MASNTKVANPFDDYNVWQDMYGTWQISASTPHQWNGMPDLPRKYDVIYSTREAAWAALYTARAEYLAEVVS